MEIRPVQPHEHATLGDLTVAAYAEIVSGPWRGDLDEYTADLRDVAGRAGGADVLVAVDPDGTLLGGVTYVPGPSSPSAEFTEEDAAGIRMLAVAPSAQRRGVGDALTRACIERAVAAGRRQVLLHSTPWMEAAHRLYARHGFARDPERDWAVGSGLVLMAFRLAIDDATAGRAAGAHRRAAGAAEAGPSATSAG